jgi:predicted RNA-binding Zn ribbon-like protein
MSEGPAKRFSPSEGNLALDFVNTVSNRRTQPADKLTDYDMLLHWAEELHALPDPICLSLVVEAGRTPGKAKNALHDAIKLREALYDIFTAVLQHRVVPQNATAILNQWLYVGAEHLRLREKQGHFKWDWFAASADFHAVLWPVARAAADLLVSEDLDRMRQCASTTCAWLFLDTTRNRRRRWCDMKTCGNRVKAQRHYERVRTAGGP